MNRYDIGETELFRGDPLEGLNPGRPDSDETIPARPGTASRNAEAPKDPAEAIREEQIESWMKNIKEFIRGIDVKAL